MGQIKRHAVDTVRTILVGSKSDLEAKRAVSTAAGKAKASQLNVSFLETSAKSGKHVQDVFTQLVTDIVQNLQPGRVVNDQDKSAVLKDLRLLPIRGQVGCCRVVIFVSAV